MTNRTITCVPAGCSELFVPLASAQAASWRAVGIHHAGTSQLVPGYQVSSPQLRSLLLIATVAGRGVAHHQQRTLRLRPGTLLVHPPGPVSFAIQGASWSLVWWYCQPGPSWSGLLAGGVRLLACPQARLLLEAQQGFCQELADGGDQALAQALGEVVLLHLRRLAGPGAAPEDPWTALWQEVDARMQEPWPVSALASRMRCSVPTLQRQLARRFGRSAHQLLLDLRMRRTLELLQRTDEPLRSIAARVGYSDPFTLSAAVRRRFGQPPSRLRSGPVAGDPAS